MRLEHANRVHLKGDASRAIRLYRDCLKKNKTDPKILFLIGAGHLQTGEHGTGAYYMREAIKRDPDMVAAYSNLIAAYRLIGLSKQAAAEGEKAIKRFAGSKKPNLCSLYTNTAATLMELGDYERAAELCRKSIEINPKDSDANWNLGLSLLSMGDFENGWEKYGHGFRAKERFARPYFDEYQEWTGEPLKGKTVLVWGEQGIGDEIVFANCFKDIARDARKVILDCHPRLEQIFRRSFPGMIVCGTRKDNTPGLFDRYDIDYHVPMGNLPAHYRKSIGSFPGASYLVPDAKAAAAWRGKAEGPRVGLSWRGGTQKTGANRRSLGLNELIIGLDTLARQAEVPVQWVSLQYGGAFEEVEQCRRALGIDVFHDERAIEDFNETANLTASCDLVITVITTAAHIAGAMGVPTWALVPQAPPWKFLAGESNPWHPSMRQFHQKTRYLWGGVTADIGMAFKKWLQEQKPS